MKAGDLVELSSYGKKIMGNYRYLHQLGMVHHVKRDLRDKEYFKVLWFGNNKTHKRKTFQNHPSKDLKHVRSEKA